MKPKLRELIALIIPLFFVAFAHAQTCKGSKVWTCRTCPGPYGTTYQQCDCVDSNKIAAWQASPCVKINNGGGGGNDYCSRHPCPCICAINQKKNDKEDIPGNAGSSGGIYPNPVINSTTIYITLDKEQEISLRIYDMNGRIVSILASRKFSEGEHQITWDATNAEAGIYFLRMEAGSYYENRKLVVLKN